MTRREAFARGAREGHRATHTEAYWYTSQGSLVLESSEAARAQGLHGKLARAWAEGYRYGWAIAAEGCDLNGGILAWHS